MRTRLMLGHAVAVAAALVVYSLVLYAQYRRNLYGGLDLKLRGRLEATDDALDEVLSGKAPETLRETETWLTEVWTDDGRRVYTSGLTGEMPLGALDERCRRSFDAFDLELGDGLKVRVFCQESSTRSGQYVLRVAMVRDQIVSQLQAFGLMVLLGIPLIVTLSAAIGYVLARRSLAPVARLTAAARSITASKLSERLPVQNADDELGELAAAFNDAFQNLEKSFHQMRRFTSDASHELRTPLTAIRTMGEVALRTQGRGKDPYETIASILEEAQHLQILCENLLLLSRADAGQLKLARTRTKLLSVATEVVDLLGILAEEKEQTLVVDVAAGLVVDVDRHLLKRAIGNLVDNAIKYSPTGAKITVQGSRTPSSIVLLVRDQGCGIALDHQKQVFERFFRVDAARGHNVGPGAGIGLGLSIAQWAIELNGGKLHVVSELGKGSDFTIEFPNADC